MHKHCNCPACRTKIAIADICAHHESEIVSMTRFSVIAKTGEITFGDDTEAKMKAEALAHDLNQVGLKTHTYQSNFTNNLLMCILIDFNQGARDAGNSLH